MVAHYGIPTPPPALGRSRVTHKLELSPQEKVKLRLALFAFFAACLTTLLLLVNVVSSPEGLPTHDEYHSQGTIFGSSELGPTAKGSISVSWASYSPYHPAGKFEGSTREGCVVSQVSILQRHGARYPTTGVAKAIIKALKKLQAAASYDDPKLHFLKNYTYDLGVNDLLKYGADQSYALGEETFKRYRTLVSGSGNVPFVRASGSKRVVLSARNWTLGFSAASEETYHSKVNLVIPETPGSNNTLGNKMCPAAASSRGETEAFIDVAAQHITARLNSAAPGANLKPRDVYAIMHLCPFDTVAKERLSPFCPIFSKEDFEIYEYAGDLEKFYNTGHALYLLYGGPLGAVQGVGYVNELIGRLTNSPAHHGLQTNKTLLSSPKTFPLNRTMYVDFSHDNLIVAVFAAMGLFNQTNGPLDTTRIVKDRTWIASKMVPFSGHMTVERLSCSDHPPFLATSRSRPMRWWKWVGVDETEDYHENNQEYVRIFVNDVRQPLVFCGAGEDGMCKLEDFVKSQEYARNDGFGDFEGCKYTGR
ncbi:phosphoglycerate mutase-like protein [Thelephora ganbajun]|uniref:Phosphoglycerate mutase-like protein n=1 Tax=Thelephora ganbajun TaxID=370292 RepID=A0ACB6Z7N9_THEGA|nr:phosphoglycerate mutase-like protein [Thelephora ganbajun]